MQSFIGNPAFLAGYFLFIIFAAFIVLFSDKNRWWRCFGGLSALMATAGVFLTQTRGAMVGLVIGAAFAVFYFAIKGKGVKFGIALVLLGVLFLGIFVVTRNNPVWQKIPGVNRFTALSYDDPSFQTRLIAAGVSLDAVNPSKNSLERFLVGWGPENFNIAYNKHYNPEYLKYEGLWFDRAHNKLLDVLVMDGALGLLAYLGIWLSILYLVFRRSASIRQNQHESVSEKSALIRHNQHESASLNNPYLSASILFFAVAYFVQNLFLFDQISTYIPFFAFLAFVISETRVNTESSPSASISQNQHKSVYISVASLVALFFAYCLIIYSFTAFYQNIKFTSAIKSGSAQRVFDDIDKFTKPYNYAQRELRNRFLNLTASHSNNQGLKPLVDKSISLFEEVVLREPYDPRYFTLLADIYRTQDGLGNVEARKKSDEYYLKALELSPKRQELLYNVAVNVYGDKGDFKMMEEYLDKMLNYAPDVPMAKIYYATAIIMEGSQRFNKGMDLIESALSSLAIALDEQQLNALRNVYNLYLNYFYDKKDSERFLTAMERTKKIELMIENINEGKYNAGLIKELPSKKSEELSRGIEGFKKMGWLAIEKK
jgi:tetratricopeptide (TPR) repeat protein